MKIRLLNYAHAGITVYLVYQYFYVPLFGGIPLLSQVLLLASFSLALINDMYARVKPTKEFVLFLTFLVVSTITSFFVAKNLTTVLDTFENMLYSICAGYLIIRISQDKGSILWVIKLIIICLVFLALYTIFIGNTALKGGRITTTEEFNSNTLAVLMVVGIWCCVYWVMNKRLKTRYMIIALLLISLMIYVILLTASRKALICAAITLLLWIVAVLLPYIAEGTTIKRIGTLLTILAMVSGIVIFFGSVYTENSAVMLMRLNKLSTDGTTWKTSMIEDAFSVFRQHPIVGVGLNNYKYYSRYGMYSHCTYVEVLACTGIIGSFFFFWMLLVTIRRSFYKLFRKVLRRIDLMQVSSTIFLLVLLILFYGQIVIYNRYLIYIYFVVVANNSLLPRVEFLANTGEKSI